MSIIDFSEQFFSGFKEFLVSQQIVGLALGSLIAVSASDTGRSLTSNLVIPLASSVFSRTVPQIRWQEILTTFSGMAIGILLIYLILRLFKITPSMPLQWTVVKNVDEVSEALAKALRNQPQQKTA